MTLTRPSLLAALLFAISLPPTNAQQGDSRDESGVVQEEIWRDMDVPPAPVLTPQQALDTFTLQDGFSLELVASEPLLNDPVAIAWDAHNRLYAIEMWTFMPDPDGTGEDLPKGRVVVLEDIDNDGRMDRSTVYLDGLVMPRAIAAVKGGIFVAEPGTLWLCQDTDGDLKADQKRKIADYASDGNVEHSENALMRALDNWIYNAKSSRRFQWDGENLRIERTSARGQWGLTMDDFGRLFYTTNSNLLLADLYPPEFSNRNPGYKSNLGTSRGIASEQRVYANRINPGVNRGYLDYSLADDNRLGRATAVSGPAIYRGDKYPERFYGNAFSPEPAANLVTRMRVNEDGFEMHAEKLSYPDEAWGRVDFLTSTDERFRPVNLYTGPDGYLYIVDMYRGILQHKDYLTTFLRKQIIERGLDEPVGNGRIYRLVHESSPRDHKAPPLAEYSELQLAETLDHPNGWTRDTAQRLLVEKETLSQETQTTLRNYIKSGDALPKIHALWVLQAHQLLDENTILDSLDSPSPWVQVHGLRVAEDLLSQSKEKSSLRNKLIDLYQSPDKKVRLQVIQSLGAITDPLFRTDFALDVYHPDIENPHFSDALVSSLAGAEEQFLVQTLRQENWLRQSGREELLGKVAKALHGQNAGDSLIAILENLDGAAHWKANAIVKSFAAIGSDKESKLANLAIDPSSLLVRIDLPRGISTEDIQNAFQWPGKESSSKSVYTETQMASIKRGEALYNRYCMACHGTDGRGTSGVAPSLNAVEWVNGSSDRLALIISQGLIGPVTVKGETWNSAMPPHGVMPDFQGQGLADVISYIRTTWNNDSGPVDLEAIQPVLEKYSDRPGPWTIEELSQIETL